jgi:hypothetical protein
MRMFTLVLSLAGGLLFAVSPASAETLPLPSGLVGFDSAEGEALLVGAESRKDYFALAQHFVTQRNQAFCGVASIAMVLNALALPAPVSPDLAPFSSFDQDNVLTPQTEAVIPRATIEKIGMTLDQVGGVLSSHGLSVEIHHAADSSLEEFRRLAAEELGAPGRFVIVNYLRAAIGQEKGGHISPLAAYDADSDRFLILDVSRYKYPPVWVSAADLYAAMNTMDSDNDNRTRGFVIAGR